MCALLRFLNHYRPVANVQLCFQVKAARTFDSSRWDHTTTHDQKKKFNRCAIFAR